MRVNSYRLSTVPDAFLRIKPLDSLVIHLMRHSSIVIIVRFYIGTTSIPLPRSSTELSERPSDRRPSDDEEAAKTAVNSATWCLDGVSRGGFQPCFYRVCGKPWCHHGVTMAIFGRPPGRETKKGLQARLLRGLFFRLFTAFRRKEAPAVSQPISKVPFSRCFWHVSVCGKPI